MHLVSVQIMLPLPPTDLLASARSDFPDQSTVPSAAGRRSPGAAAASKLEPEPRRCWGEAGAQLSDMRAE
jgi:hypothetical protein